VADKGDFSISFGDDEKCLFDDSLCRHSCGTAP
jgi:hypothetical protein